MTDYNRKRLSVNFKLSFHVTFHPAVKFEKNEITKLVSWLTSSKRKKMSQKEKNWVEAVVEKFVGNSCLPKTKP